MKLPCAVVRDLLPLYTENMTEPETRCLIGGHLADCPECSRKLAEMQPKAAAPVETAEPLKKLRREIRRRRLYAAAIAALCVFAAVFTFFFRESAPRPVPWEEGLIRVKGVEKRTYAIGQHADPGPSGKSGSETEYLVILTDDRINAARDSAFTDEDGTTTVFLEGWTTGGDKKAGSYHETVFAPVPDRLIYNGGDTQQLLWGEPLNGGVEMLPRLALGYYVILSAAAAAVLGILWLLLRRHKCGRILRQLFFAPVSYIAAHFLLKGTGTESFFLQRDFFSILLMALALYALLSLLWQEWTRRTASGS